MDADSIRMHFARGVEHFDSQRFFEAHEEWEAIWLEASEQKNFLQGLIQTAAAYHQWRRGRFRGALRLLERARHRLESERAATRPVDLESLVIALSEAMTRVAAGAEFDANAIQPLPLRGDWTLLLDS